MMGVIHSGGAWNRTPIYGTSGMRIPKPRMSITLTMKSEPSRLSISCSHARTTRGSVVGNELPQIGARPGGRRNKVPGPADDEVGNSAVIPVSRRLAARAREGNLQRLHHPHRLHT